MILGLRAGACRVCPRAGTPGWAQGTHPRTAGTQCPPKLLGMELSTHMWVLYLLKCLLGQISSRKWLLRNRREIKMGSYNILLRQENDRDIFGRSASTGIFRLFLAATGNYCFHAGGRLHMPGVTATKMVWVGRDLVDALIHPYIHTQGQLFHPAHVLLISANSAFKIYLLFNSVLDVNPKMVWVGP